MVVSRTCALGQVSILASLEMLRTAKALLPAPGDLHLVLQALNAQRGVPVIVEEVINQPKFYFGIGGLYLIASRAGEAAAFATIEVRPLRLPDQDRLAREALWVTAERWQISEPRAARPTKDAQKVADHLIHSWRALSRAPLPPTEVASKDAERERYLDHVEALIGLTRRLEQDRLLQNGPGQGFPYHHIESGDRGRYILHLAAGAPRPRPRMQFRLREAPEIRGSVIGPARVGIFVEFGTTRIEELPDRGVLEELPSLTQYAVQRSAVETLRAGGASNPHLLDILVEHHYQAVARPKRPEPAPPMLDPDQAAAWRAAQLVPDALLVLGPPGTGKTHTIAQIAQTVAARGQKILVTARTHRAVDNALERLSQVPGLRLLRVGQPDRIAPGMRDLLLDQQAEALQEQILGSVGATIMALGEALRGLGDVTPLDQAHRDEDQRSGMEAELAEIEAAIIAERRSIDRRYGVPMRLWETELAPDVARLVAQDHALAALTAQRAALVERSKRPLIGVFWGIAHLWLKGKIARRRASRAAWSDHLHEEGRDYLALRALHDAALVGTPIRDLEARQEALRQTMGITLTTARSWIAELDATIAPIAAERPALNATGGSPTAYADWVRSMVPIWRERLVIATAWEAALRAGTDVLVPVLLENADVVGATCIGVATTRDLPDEEFDLVIVDEAGQIGLADLLVPLVRARRAILVGDHHQLPPFVPDEVQEWLAERGTEPGLAAGGDLRQATDLLTRSAFELLFPRAEATHRVLLTRQKRMPRAIADFIARHFYGGQLQTEHDTPPPASAPYVPAALTWIDTADQPRPTRAEQAANSGNPEGFNQKGYRNPSEIAQILTMVPTYQQAGLDWVVITPYQAQAEAIRTALSLHLGKSAPEDLAERVATVDAFQGGERDYVFFSFTRSNEQGSVGFLSELRRLNVTMSRARRQLILIGDVAMLCAARDVAFQRVAKALLEHTLAQGERIRSSDLPARIAAWNEARE